MPKVSMPISGLNESVGRPVVFSVIRELVDRTGLPKDINVFFPGEGKQAVLGGSALEDVKLSSGLSTNNKFTLSVEERYLEEHLLTAPVRRPENVLIFKDQDLGVLMKPAYAPTEVAVTVTFRAEDRVTAEGWRNSIKHAVRLGEETHLHELNYHYAIPKPFMIVLTHIAELKEKQGGYGEDLAGWFGRCFSDRVTRKSNLSGERSLVAINEKQVGVEGWYDFEGVPDKEERTNERASREISFTYKFVYDKPTGCVFQYPFLVHNQLIDSKFRDKHVPYDHEQLLNEASGTTHYFSQIRQVDNQVSPIPGYVIPYWDEWQSKLDPPYLLPLITAMIAVDPNDPQAVLNLKQLGDYSITEGPLRFIETNWHRLTNSQESPFVLSLYLNDIPLDTESLVVNGQLDVRTRVPMDIRGQYHLRLSLSVDFFRYSNRLKGLLRKDGLLLSELFISIALWYGIDIQQAPRLLEKNYVSNTEFERVAQLIKNRLRPIRTSPRYYKKHVGSYVIQAKRQ